VIRPPQNSTGGFPASLDEGLPEPSWLAARRRLAMLCMVGLLLLHSGCSGNKYLVQRDTPFNPLAMQLQLKSRGGPTISGRVESVLRRYALLDLYKQDSRAALEEMQQLIESESDGELIYSISEVAYVLGKRAESRKDVNTALDMYGVSVSNAYMYLFASQFDAIRNPYDPQFRGACDLYNESLESTLRLVDAGGLLKPGGSYPLTTGKQTYQVQTVLKGNWSSEAIERFEFVSDYELEGLPASGLTYGLGVPLIAVRRKGNPQDPREKYYPDGLSFPVTALLRVVRPGVHTGQEPVHRHQCVLEFHDSLASRDIQIADRLVPLQTDHSTALAYFLDSPQFRKTDQATLGFLNPQETDKLRGLYMLEPFDPTRIPVVMVHGLWSSPMTWMPMFNDLRSFSELRKNYQFWFYQYPTGQPFWMSATQLRTDLAELREHLDPDRRYEALNYTVLVGHSMGGLVCRMQTIDSRDQFWQLLSDVPFENVRGDPEDLQKLKQAAFFKPSPDIRRVIMLGTPHRGSDYANDAARWLSRQLIRLPTMMVSTGQTLVTQNPGVFQNKELLTSNTSIDSLSPASPVFPAMLRAPRAPWIEYHNIVGLIPTKRLFSKETMTTDGVVEYESARLDDVASEIIVETEHRILHRHPKSILEVRRILIEHLESVEAEYRVAQRMAQLTAGRPQPIKP
jgi:pimeloyl-ACP methyl ester carboxylesterase